MGFVLRLFYHACRTSTALPQQLRSPLKCGQPPAGNCLAVEDYPASSSSPANAAIFFRPRLSGPIIAS